MKIVADLHIHSKFSRATSPNMNLEVLTAWSRIKGISLMGTGDFTQPTWFSELEKKMKETKNGSGFYTIDNKEPQIYFVPTAEISCIYSKGGKVRRNHIVLIAPSLRDAKKINDVLGKKGNLVSDGRPILGMDSEVLVETILSVAPDTIIMPAHIWTPWFSMFGSNSGFDSVEECFGKQAKNIFAIETGLSSDPEMNWRLSQLDGISIVSNSDCHSPSKIGREATVFDIEPNFKSLRNALKNPKKGEEILYTIEFYPEEGKYHFTGHRNCNYVQSPEVAAKEGTICPICKKQLTVGVMHRVEELADRPFGFKDKKRPPYKSLVPLLEIVAESMDIKSTSSKKVHDRFLEVIKEFGTEFGVLLDEPLEKIKNFDEKLADGIRRMREGKINIKPGYDGVFGVVKIWED